jgi:hypothetical protein
MMYLGQACLGGTPEVHRPPFSQRAAPIAHPQAVYDRSPPRLSMGRHTATPPKEHRGSGGGAGNTRCLRLRLNFLCGAAFRSPQPSGVR